MSGAKKCVNRFNGLPLDRALERLSFKKLRQQPADKPLKRFLNVHNSGSPG
jgi:hypothetical protein